MHPRSLSHMPVSPLNKVTVCYRLAVLCVPLLVKAGQVGGQVGEDRLGKLNGEVAGHADFRLRRTRRARESARMSVSVSVPWNSS